MSSWPEDLSSCSLKEVLGWQAENRAWNKEIRLKTNTLVNSRLAKNISQATFTLYDLAGNTNSVALNNAKGISLNLKLQTFIGSRIQSEDYLSAAYDMRNTAN